jgi:glycerophosphoryl diester phosphodiesterase
MKIVLLFSFFVAYLGFGQETLVHFTPDFFHKQRFAHRGGYASGPENTIHTILYNINHGVSAVEIDVQLTKDNQLVVFHDDSISRVLATDRKASPRELSLAEIQQYPLRDRSQGIQYVCSLEQLIDTLSVLVPMHAIQDFLLEVDFKVKGGETKVGVKELMRITQHYVANIGEQLYQYFFVSSFYPGVLKEIRVHDKKMKLAFAVHDSPLEQKLKARIAIVFAPVIMRKYGASIIEPNLCMVGSRFVKKYKRKGFLVNTYTVNTTCEKSQIEQFEIAFTTNCPIGFCAHDSSGQIQKNKRVCKQCN